MTRHEKNIPRPDSRTSPVTFKYMNDHLTAGSPLKSILVNKATQGIELWSLSLCHFQVNDAICRPSDCFRVCCDVLPHEYANFSQENDRSDRKSFLSNRTKAFVFLANQMPQIASDDLMMTKLFLIWRGGFCGPQNTKPSLRQSELMCPQS